MLPIWFPTTVTMPQTTALVDDLAQAVLLADGNDTESLDQILAILDELVEHPLPTDAMEQVEQARTLLMRLLEMTGDRPPEMMTALGEAISA